VAMICCAIEVEEIECEGSLRGCGRQAVRCGEAKSSALLFAFTRPIRRRGPAASHHVAERTASS
jgi:hypothetical protein